MSWLENLKNLIDINIKFERLININKIEVTRAGGNEPLTIDDGSNEAVLDIDAIPENKRDEVQAQLREGRLEQGQISSNSAYEKTREIEGQTDNSRIHETLEFFEPKISDEHLDILRSALVLREVFEDDEVYLSRQEVNRWRSDIREKHGPDAFSITNLCTAGYFDQGRYLRELYQEMKESDDWKEGDYQEIFEDIVENEPFTVFVSRGDDDHHLKERVYEKLGKCQKYDVDVSFIDVRGMGKANRRKIERLLYDMDGELDDIEYREGIRGGEFVARIDTESVEGLEELSN